MKWNWTKIARVRKTHIWVLQVFKDTPEIYKKLLIWLQDINWPGSDIIFNFVVENINDFSYSIKETLLEALYNNDDVWIISILTAVYKNKGLTNKEINGQLEKVQKLLINENNFENLIKLFDDILDQRKVVIMEFEVFI